MDTQPVVDLLNDYAHRLDTADFEGFAELFRHGRWQGLEGYDETLGWLRAHVRLYDGSTRTAHVVTNVSVTPRSATTATARSYIQVLHQPSPDEPIRTLCLNRYEDVFERDAGGWHFAVREIVRVLRGDMSSHLHLERSAAR